MTVPNRKHRVDEKTRRANTRLAIIIGLVAFSFYIYMLARGGPFG